MTSARSAFEVLDRLGATLRQATRDPVAALDEPLLADDPDAGTRADVVPDDRPPVDAVVEASERERLAYRLLEQLPPRESAMLRLRFGLYNGDALSLEDVGRVAGLSRQRVQQIETRALSAARELVAAIDAPEPEDTRLRAWARAALDHVDRGRGTYASRISKETVPEARAALKAEARRRELAPKVAALRQAARRGWRARTGDM